MNNIIYHDRLVHHDRLILKEMYEIQNNHKGCVIWFTGLSASGKSTIANQLEYKLHTMGMHTVLLDGDNIRLGLNAGLGFSAKDREENIRRIGSVAKIFEETGIIAITAFISPYRKDRDRVRKSVDNFIEVFVYTPLKVCEERDPKGMYKLARTGEIKNFTGISDPYEEPINPELILKGAEKTPNTLANEIIDYLLLKGIIYE